MVRLSLLSVISASLGVAFVACEGGAPPPSEPVEPSEPITAGAEATPNADLWPREFVSGPGTGPALYLHEGADAPALGYISEGVELELGGLPQGNRAPVRIRGALKVRAWISVDRLSHRVQRKGRVPDTPTYLSDGDFVQIVGPATDENLLMVSVTPRLGCEPRCVMPAYTGVYPRDRLAPTAPASPEPLEAGEGGRLPAGQDVSVYDRPGGSVVATLPAMDPPLVISVLRDRGEWKGIRAGIGPYIVGYINASLEAADLPNMDSLGQVDDGAIPDRLAAEADKPLYRLATGTRVKFDGQTVGILSAEGWGREMNRYEQTGQSDVFVAVNNDIALRGMVRTNELQQAPEQPAAPAESESPPAAPADDTIQTTGTPSS